MSQQRQVAFKDSDSWIFACVCVCARKADDLSSCSDNESGAACRIKRQEEQHELAFISFICSLLS